MANKGTAQAKAIVKALQSRGASPGKAISGLVDIDLGGGGKGSDDSGFWDFLNPNLNNYEGLGTKGYQPPITKAGSTLFNWLSKAINPNLGATMFEGLGTKGYRNGLTDLGAWLSDNASLGASIIPQFIKGATTGPKAAGKTASPTGRTGATPGRGSGTGALTPPLFGGEYPEWSDFDPGDMSVNWTPPTLERRDFSEEANSKIAAAFAPLFADFERQRNETSARGARNQQMVGGLYDKYVQSIADDAAQTQQRYDTTEAERATQGTDLANNVGGYYQSANQNTADLLKSIGAQQAAPELLQQGANEQAVQQSQVGQGTQAMQDYYGKQEQSAADQAVAYQDIGRNEGVRGQANVMADTSKQLGDIGSQEAEQRAQNAAMALQMAMQLSDSDFSAQQANAGLGFQGAQLQGQNNQAKMDAALRAYQAATGTYDAKRQNATDQFDVWLKTQGLNLDRQKVLGEAGGKPVELTGPLGAANQGNSVIGQQATADVIQAINTATAGSNINRSDPQQINNAYVAAMKQAQQIAAKNGVPVQAVIATLDQYWSSIYGK